MAVRQVEVIGADRLAATTRRVAGQLGDLSRVNGVTARYLAARASALAPRLTGTLAASITPAGGPGDATVSTGLNYAPIQEFGWPGHNIAAIHYMSRASKTTEPVAIRAHETNLNRLISTIKGA